MIVSFRHKGLQALYETGSKKGVQPAHASKLTRILGLLDVVQGPADLTIPGFRTHELKGDLADHRSIWVNGNWRVTFRFVGQDVELVDYQSIITEGGPDHDEQPTAPRRDHRGGRAR